MCRFAFFTFVNGLLCFLFPYVSGFWRADFSPPGSNCLQLDRPPTPLLSIDFAQASAPSPPPPPNPPPPHRFDPGPCSPQGRLRGLFTSPATPLISPSPAGTPCPFCTNFPPYSLISNSLPHVDLKFFLPCGPPRTTRRCTRRFSFLLGFPTVFLAVLVSRPR